MANPKLNGLMGVGSIADRLLKILTMGRRPREEGRVVNGHVLKWGANLTGANLSGENLTGAFLLSANLAGANLTRAFLIEANLGMADLSEANLTEANLLSANLTGANLAGANLSRAEMAAANLINADLTGADLTGASLTNANLVGSVLDGATLTGARVFGTSVWDVTGVPAAQNDLVITPHGEADITVDDLKIAQFIYLLLNNEEIRDVIDTVARKAVLILGRFTPERKQILDSLRDTLREHNYAPILFDFDKPAERDLTETVRTLAHLSRFIIADLTDPSSIPQELQAIVPDLAVPVVPILAGDEPYAMFRDLRRKYHWVLKIHRYEDQQGLLDTLTDDVIAPAESKVQELAE